LLITSYAIAFPIDHAHDGLNAWCLMQMSCKLEKPNCWEYQGCGREPGGSRAADLGICPAAATQTVDGVNRGRMGGRICWILAGTLCGGRVQGTYAMKLETCFICPFYRQVMKEEGDGFQPELDVLKKVFSC
jgi:hypothetical protein